MEKKKIRNDLLLLGAMLLVAIIIFLVFTVNSCMGKGREKIVNVSINGDVLKSYTLSEDARATISTGENSTGKNVLVIKDGEAFIESANCRDQICVNHAHISEVGETIVCLPHTVVISVEYAGE